MAVSPLQRLRLLFLLPTFATLALAVAELVAAPGPAFADRALGFVAAAVLGVGWTVGYRRGGFPTHICLPEALTLFVLLVHVPADVPLPLVAVSFRSLYGTWPVAARRAVFYGMAMYASLHWTHAATWSATANHLLGLAIAAFAVTSLQRALQGLEGSERRLRAILAHSGDAILVVSPGGRIRWCSPSSDQVLGAPSDALVGTDLRDLVASVEAGTVAAELAATVRGGDAPREIAATLRTRDGTPREIEILASHPRDGDVDGLVLNVRDVTERRRVERLRVQLEAERERQELEAQLHQARRMESMGRLAGGVAHDFNNLLAVILNCASLAREELDDDHPAAEEVEGIEDAARRGARLVRHLLQFAQRKPAAVATVDVNHAVEGMERLLSRALGDGAELAYELAPALEPVEADVSGVEQVLVNLVVNARDALEGQSGTITISTGNHVLAPEEAVALAVPAGHYVRLSVADDGVGMSPETLARWWEPFYTTKGPGEGTGLGLSTVVGIAKQAGGCVAIDSEPGVGTTVHVSFPAATEAEPDGAELSALIARRA